MCSFIPRSVRIVLSCGLMVVLAACAKTTVDCKADAWLQGDYGIPPAYQGLGDCPTSVEEVMIIDCDQDGIPANFDCDDHDSLRAPDVEERCDGIDNNCDDRIDEGFGVDSLCATGDACQPVGRLRCANDQRSVFCEFDDVGCL